MDVYPAMHRSVPDSRGRGVQCAWLSAEHPIPAYDGESHRFALPRREGIATCEVPRFPYRQWEALLQWASGSVDAQGARPPRVLVWQQGGRLSALPVQSVQGRVQQPPTQRAQPAPPHNRDQHIRGEHPLRLPQLLPPAVLPLRNYTFLPGADVFSTVRRRSLLTEATSPDSATGMVHWTPPARAKGTGLSPRDFPFTKIRTPIAAGLFPDFSTSFLLSNSTDFVEILSK
jgi:hypothetical protein